MRVHELDEVYGISKDDVKVVLTLAGLPTHHLSQVDDEELKSFEIALELFKEDSEHSASAEAEEDVEEVLLDFSEELPPAIELPDGPEIEPIEADLDGVNELVSEEDFDFESTPARDSFPLCNDRGAEIGENCLLDPALAAKVRKILKPGQRINDYQLNMDQGHLEFIVWETAQKHRVRID